MKLTDKQKLETYGEFLKEFKYPVIQNIVEKIIINTPTIYFGASTSSTGKHHPKVVNGLTGLVRHSVATMLTAKEFLDNEIIMKVFQMSELSELDKEIILAACLLHDNAKYGVEEKSGDEKYYTLGEHPRLFKELVKKAGLHKELKGEDLKILYKINNLVETHMGQWTKVRHQKDLAKPSSYAQAFVHMCDYVVSKKTLDTVESISLPEDVTPELIKWFETQV